MQQMLAIIVVVLTNLTPAGVTECNLQIIDGDKRAEIQFTRQADGGWKAQSGKELKEPLTFYVDGTKVTTKTGDEMTTEDLSKHLTIGAMPFKMTHRADGFDFVIEAEKRDGRIVEEEKEIKVRWDLISIQPRTDQTDDQSGPQPSRATAPFDSDRAKKHQQAWADYLSLPVEYTNSIGMKLVLIPAGEFQMGGGKSPDEIVRTFELDANYAKEFTDEHPQHKVRISQPFYLGTKEVTQGQWESVVGTRPWEGKSLVKEGKDYAASYVSWEDAQEFCRKLSGKEGVKYRLPTEAEWEYSCRAGTTSVFHFGDDVKHLGDCAWFNDNAYGVGEGYVHEAGRKKPNPFGLYDMHGNVREWCKDLYGEEYYAKSPAVDPQGSKDGARRVSRGGSWGSTARRCRSADRFWIVPSGRGEFQGFRVVRSLFSADQEQARQQREEQAELEERRRQAEQEFDEAFNQGDWIESNEENMLQQAFDEPTNP